jgi:hypothetical protein
MEGSEKIADYVEIFPGTDGDWYFRAMSTNGEEIYRSSEGYKYFTDARKVAADTGLPVRSEQK